MWITKRFGAAALAAVSIVTLLFGGCSEQQAQGEVLLQPVESQSESKNLLLAEAKVGSISRSTKSDLSVRYKEQTIYCDFDGATFLGYEVSPGDIVKEGDVLARFDTEYSQADRQSLEAELRIAKSSAERQKSAAAQNVADARAALNAADKSDARGYKRLQLALERAEIAQKKTVAACDKSVNAAQQALDNFDDGRSHSVILAPEDGYVANVEFRGEGTPIARGSKICTLVTFGDISLVGAFERSLDAVLYGQNATIEVLGAAGEVDAKVITAPNLFGRDMGEFAVEIPASLMDEILNNTRLRASADRGRRYPEISMIYYTLERFRIDDVLTVPNSAIKTEDGSRFVYVMQDGRLRKRFVVIGTSDDKNTQVIAGIQPGDRVSVG